jgi:hypothetical protein
VKLPEVEEYPISFERALRISCGGRSRGDHWRWWRAWWRSELARFGSPDNADDVIAYFQRVGCDSQWVRTFTVGISGFKAAERKARSRRAALTRWQKDKKFLPSAKGVENSAVHASKSPDALVCGERIDIAP